MGESTYRRTEGQPSLDPDSVAGKAYLADHDRAVEWATANRLAIATRAARALNADVQLMADTPHNLLVQANGAWLHRKGAAVATNASVPLAGSRDSFSYLLAPTGAADTPFASEQGQGTAAFASVGSSRRSRGSRRIKDRCPRPAPPNGKGQSQTGLLRARFR